jgi:hypothetical protein
MSAQENQTFNLSSLINKDNSLHEANLNLNVAAASNGVGSGGTGVKVAAFLVANDLTSAKSNQILGAFEQAVYAVETKIANPTITVSDNANYDNEKITLDKDQISVDEYQRKVDEDQKTVDRDLAVYDNLIIEENKTQALNAANNNATLQQQEQLSSAVQVRDEAKAAVDNAVVNAQAAINTAQAALDAVKLSTNPLQVALSTAQANVDQLTSALPIPSVTDTFAEGVAKGKIDQALVAVTADKKQVTEDQKVVTAAKAVVTSDQAVIAALQNQAESSTEAQFFQFAANAKNATFSYELTDSKDQPILDTNGSSQYSSIADLNAALTTLEAKYASLAGSPATNFVNQFNNSVTQFVVLPGSSSLLPDTATVLLYSPPTVDPANVVAKVVIKAIVLVLAPLVSVGAVKQIEPLSSELLRLTVKRTAARRTLENLTSKSFIDPTIDPVIGDLIDPVTGLPIAIIA